MVFKLEHEKREDAQDSISQASAEPYSAVEAPPALSQSLLCLRLGITRVTPCAAMGGDNSAVVSKRELVCLLTEEITDNLQANVCISMCPKFLTHVSVLKLVFLRFSSTPLISLFSAATPLSTSQT